MHRWAVFLVGVSLVLNGCNNGDNSYALVEARISNRPLVGVVPIIDHSRNDLNWNVSQELSIGIREKLAQRNQVYLLSEETVSTLSHKAFALHDPFGIDISWIKRSFPEHEFVVFTELQDHHEIPLQTEGENAPAELHMSVRVRVIDLRGKTPKIALQEIIEQSHHIPSPFTKGSTEQVPWTDENFDVSPLGIAHATLCKELAARIEDYILIKAP